MIKIVVVAILSVALNCIPVYVGYVPRDRANALAHALAEPSSRDAAIGRMRTSPATFTPLLLTWVRICPAGVDEHAFSVGLIDAIREMDVRESISYLVENINIKRYPGDIPPWLKTDRVVEERMPAVAALLTFGTAAAGPLTQAWREEGDYREALLYTVARIGDQSSREFLLAIQPQNRVEAAWVKRGLELINPKGPGNSLR